jgi:glutamate synthase (NADPH/NADH) small chain
MPFEALIRDNSIENKNGKIVLRDKASTNIAGVFAGGDCVNGGKEVVDAVQAGKDGAKAVLSFLNKK